MNCIQPELKDLVLSIFRLRPLSDNIKESNILNKTYDKIIIIRSVL